MHRYKSAPTDPTATALGPDMIHFFKQSVAKRQTKLGKLAECWGRLVPVMLSDHCALESFHRGTLVVMVDSSSHLYEVKQLLLAGLEKQLLIACKGAGLRKITLKIGRWYEGEDSQDKRVKFGDTREQSRRNNHGEGAEAIRPKSPQTRRTNIRGGIKS